MPHIPVHPSAQKRHRQNLKRQDRNRAVKSHVRNVVKIASEAIASGDAGAPEKLREATRALQKAASAKTLHPKATTTAADTRAETKTVASQRKKPGMNAFIVALRVSAPSPRRALRFETLPAGADEFDGHVE